MSEGQKPMPDSKVKELSDMPWKQREESRTWQKERVIQELRSQGKRMTKQRMILLDVILSGKWNCCKEIYYEAAKRDAAIGMATVYRMVSTLEEIGVFSRCYRYSLPDRPCVEEQAGDWMDSVSYTHLTLPTKA